MVSPTAELAVGGDLEASSSTTPDQVKQLVAKARVGAGDLRVLLPGSGGRDRPGSRQIRVR